MMERNPTVFGQTYQGGFPANAGEYVSILDTGRLLPPSQSPRVHTVQLQRTLVRGQAENSDWRAVIWYGIGGCGEEITCDWRHGCQLKLAANVIKVSAVSFAPDPTQAYGPPGYPAAAQWSLTAAVAEFAGSGDSRPTLTRYYNIAAAGGAVSDVPPTFARSFRLLASEPAAPAADVYPLLWVQQNLANGAAYGTSAVNTLSSAAVVPLIGTSLTVTAPAIAGGVNIAIQYDLGI